MATPKEIVYSAFLSSIEEDDWVREFDEEVVKADLDQLLLKAIFDFRFPRISLELEGDFFVNNITNAEAQILATSMRLHWLRRQANSWRNIKQQYSTKDFQLSSQANHLDKILKSLEMTEKEVKRMYDTYGRSINGKPFDYGKLAGGGKNA